MCITSPLNNSVTELHGLPIKMSVVVLVNSSGCTLLVQKRHFRYTRVQHLDGINPINSCKQFLKKGTVCSRGSKERWSREIIVLEKSCCFRNPRSREPVAQSDKKRVETVLSEPEVIIEVCPIGDTTFIVRHRNLESILYSCWRR